jgi:FtsP/CotA-like multicopper oxidase with cupredoxin domain
VPMLRLAPAERVSAVVEMKQPGVWVLGEVRKHIREAGMGVVLEYEGRQGEPQWIEPKELAWDYFWFARTGDPAANAVEAERIPLVFQSKFVGHGAMDHWTINGKSFPDTEKPVLKAGRRYRLQFINRSTNNHPVHLHRHTFELCRPQPCGLRKDVVLVGAQSQVDVEFTADDPGATLFHCHQQNHMDAGFMMLFQYE